MECGHVLRERWGCEPLVTRFEYYVLLSCLCLHDINYCCKVFIKIASGTHMPQIRIRPGAP